MTTTDELLIFKMRAKKKEEQQQAVAQKPVQEEQQAPAPPPVQKPVQKPPPQPEYEEQQKPEEEEQPPVIVYQPPPTLPEAEPQRAEPQQKPRQGRFFGRKPTKEEVRAAARREERVAIQPPPREFLAEEEAELAGSRVGGKHTKYEDRSRKAAEGLYCAWHPWRSAYAICTECHRPFCYEDIVEYNGKYYCLEDVDKVASGAGTAELGVGYNKISLISASASILPIAIYLYFTNGILTYIATYFSQVGVTAFIANFSYAYGIALAGMLFTFLQFVSALLIFGQSRKAYGFGIFSGFLAVALFTYEFISSFAWYTLAISILSFIALVTLGYSKNAYEPIETKESVLAKDVGPYDWPNVGRF